jgi:hypothetical protein
MYDLNRGFQSIVYDGSVSIAWQWCVVSEPLPVSALITVQYNYRG